MNGGGSYQHSGGCVSGPHQAQGGGRCSVVVSFGIRLTILKQGISVVLAYVVLKKPHIISNLLADLVVQ